MKDTHRSMYVGSHIASEIAPLHYSGDNCKNTTKSMGFLGRTVAYPTTLSPIKPEDDHLHHFGGGERAENILEWLMR